MTSGRSRHSLAILCAALAALCAWATAATVFAHAAPEVLRIVWREPGNRILLVTNRGLIFADADNGPWRLMCNEALHINTTEKPDISSLPDGRLWVTTHAGLLSSADEGCSWQGVEPFVNVSTQAVRSDPSQPTRVYVASYGQGRGGIRVTEDGGATFTLLLAVPDNDYIRALRIAPSKPEQLYACGSTFDSSNHYMHYVASSSDRGASWQRFDVALPDSELGVELLAISPKDPQLLLAKATGVEPRAVPERLLLSRDGGRSFSSPFATKALRDATFSADGMTVWVVGVDGLWRSTADIQNFERIGTAQSMTCVTEHAGELKACGYYMGFGGMMDGIGLSKDSGDSFTPWMSFTDVSDVIACAPDSNTAVTCQMPAHDWELERAQFGNGSSMVFADGGPSLVDAGVPADAGGGAVLRRDAALPGPKLGAAGTTSSRGNGSHAGGCNVSNEPGCSGPTNPGWLLLGVLLTSAVRGRSRRRESPYRFRRS